MTFVKINPLTNFENIHDNLQRYFEEFSKENYSECSANFPPVDIRFNKEKIFLDIEVPGIKKEELKLSVKNYVLTIEGEKHAPQKGKGETEFRLERTFGKFKRSFNLPKNSDTNSIKAKHENGILYVELNKIVPKEPEIREIDVN